MKTTFRRVVSFVMAMAMVLSFGGLNAFAITEANSESVTINATNITATKSDAVQTVNVVLYMDKDAEVSNMDAKISINDTDNMGVTFAGGATYAVPQMTGITNLTSGTTTGGFSMGDMYAGHNVAKDDSLNGYVLVTIPLSIPANAVGTATVNFSGLNIADFDNASGYTLTSDSATATITVSEAAPTAHYTANISTTATEFKVNDTVAVTVNVGGTVGSFASSEVTLTYEPTYLTFDQANSTLNGAGVDLTTANTIKLVDHGDTNGYPDAYVLNFTAAKATTGAEELVTLADARFSTAENAISADLIEATGENALSLTIKNADLKVTLPESGVVTGNATVPYGDSYTFTAENNNTYMYYDYEVSATMGGQTATVKDNGNGTWTIENVTGDLVIEVTETPKTYKVTVNGDSTVTNEEIAKVTTSAVDGKATYNTALTYTLPAGQAANGAVDGYHYIATVTVGGNSYTASSNGLTYTIGGDKVTGDIVITLSKVVDLADSVKVTIEGSNEIQKDGETVTELIAAKNSKVTLALVPEAGYTYEISDGTEKLTINDDNTFTVSVGTTPVTITVTKTLDTTSVNVQQYIQLDGTVMWLVTINGNGTTEISGKTYSYNSQNMYWSSKYQAYCYLVVAETLSVSDATAKIGDALVDANAVKVEYNMDVNNTNNHVDANDAQLVYNMYQTKAYDDFSTVDMIKFLEADLNSAVGVDSTDAQVVVNELLNITTN